MNIKDWEKEFKGMFWYSKEKAQILCFIRKLLSLQKQEIVEEIEFSQFDADDIMRDWTKDDWVNADEDDREIADLINNKFKQKLTNYEKYKRKNN